MTQVFAVTMIDETGCYFTRAIAAADHCDAEDIAAEEYPDATVYEVESPADTQAAQYDRYQRANAIYENPDLDDYGY